MCALQSVHGDSAVKFCRLRLADLHGDRVLEFNPHRVCGIDSLGDDAAFRPTLHWHCLPKGAGNIRSVGGLHGNPRGTPLRGHLPSSVPAVGGWTTTTTSA